MNMTEWEFHRHAAANKSLKKLVLPDSVEKVEPMAFYNCKALKTVSVSEGIGIDRTVFNGCLLSDFAIRGNAPSHATSLREMVNGTHPCEAEILDIVKDFPYHFVNPDES